MKKISILFSLLLFVFIGLNAQAQIKAPKLTKSLGTGTDLTNEVLSKELVKAINPSSALDISADNLLKLEKNNKSYVNDLLGIFNGSGSDEEKKALALGKQKERKDFIEGLLGEGKAAKYYKLIKPQVEPLIKKYALAKFLL